MNFRKILEWLIVVIVFTAPSIALLTPYSSSANYKLLILLGLILGWKELRKLNAVEISIFAGLLLLFLANVISFSQTQDVMHGYKWLGKYLLLVMGIFAYVVIKPRMHLIRRHFDLFLILNGLLIGGAAIYQHFVVNIYRVSGMTHPIFFGDVSVALFTLALSRTLIGRAGWLLYATLLLFLFSGISSGTRGAIIAAPVVLVILLMFRARREKFALRMVLIVLAMTLASFIAIDKNSHTYRRLAMTYSDLNAFVDDRNNTSGTSTRFEIWINGIRLWRQSPVLGIGPGDYGLEMKKMVDSGTTFNTLEVNYRWTAHSNLVHALVTSGIVGLLAHLVALYLIPFYWILKYRDKFERCAYLLATITAYFIFGLTTTWIASHGGFSLFMLFFLMSLGYLNSGESDDKDVQLSNKGTAKNLSM
jgi:O-antigen ligase